MIVPGSFIIARRCEHYVPLFSDYSDASLVHKTLSSASMMTVISKLWHRCGYIVLCIDVTGAIGWTFELYVRIAK